MKDLRRKLLVPVLFGVCLAAQAGGQKRAGAEADWIEAMRQTHARFTGQRGTFAQFGDSITVTMAFWTPLQSDHKNAPPEMEPAFARVKARLRPECWRDWKGPEFGSEGGQTTRWAKANLGGWLKRLNPEVALILFGSNDLRSLELPEYRDNLRALVRQCLENGTVVILSTIPPRSGFEQKAAEFAKAAREVAREMKVPLTDYYAEIIKRRPNDWNGAAEKFRAYKDYEVPTLISRDGVHPSFPGKYQNDYSAEGLTHSGYTLRNFLTLMKYAEVIQALDKPKTEEEPVKAAREEGGALLPPDRSWFPKAPPLPLPTGDVVRVASVEALSASLERARPGQTILLADGHYRLSNFIEIKTDRVTLRGESGRRERVILDGGGTLGELLKVTACSDVTIADLTVQNVQWNGIKINSETNVQRLRITNCILHNIWQRAVKGVMVPKENREQIRPANFRIEFCLFYNDHPKRYADDPADTPENFRGNYIGGIDAMYLRGWTICDNVFVGIQGRTREARGAIFLWHDARDCLIERNVIIACDSGICLGNSHRPEDVQIHATGFLVRNNFITRAPENSILADYTRDCKIVHNTVFDPDSRLGRLIRLVHDNDGLLVADNLLGGADIRNESQSRIVFVNNLAGVPANYFVAPEEGNLRVTAKAVEAIDHAAPQPEVTEDIDHHRRDAKPDIGADEFLPEVYVQDAEGFRQAMRQAKPGTRLLLAPGTYRGVFFFSNVHGAPGKPIIVAAADPKDPPQFLGTSECLHFSQVSYLELHDLTLRGASDNGLNIDDGGNFEQPSHHVTLRGLHVSDIGPRGNHDGIKLSGIEDFLVRDCVIERWGDGGSGVDMVGCHRGEFAGCAFRQGGSEGIQAKGGCSEIVVRGCRFEDYGERGVNIGGNTDLPFFRPKITAFPADRRYEARDIRVEGNVFLGGTAPVAFVGVDGAVVRFNTIYHPKRWALRILQETREAGFVPSRNGRFEANIVVFQSESWFEGGVNIGPGTAPQTFQFARNVWYCEDRPERSQPVLPTPESDALLGQNPLFRDPTHGDFTLPPNSPATGRGA